MTPYAYAAQAQYAYDPATYAAQQYAAAGYNPAAVNAVSAAASAAATGVTQPTAAYGSNIYAAHQQYQNYHNPYFAHQQK
mmetsp:Transcript_48407/g.43385  ORF Transcript_48407/g.43385 Transcript_48407/m.43385 type:complete len:80 (+) Transcript_48407:1-240(+)